MTVMINMYVHQRKDSGPIPADEMAHQIITDYGNFTLDLKQHGFCASALHTLLTLPKVPKAGSLTMVLVSLASKFA